MRQLDLSAVHRTSRLLAIMLATVTLMSGTGILKRNAAEKVYQSPVSIEPDEPNLYTLRVEDPGKLIFTIPPGVRISPEPSCGQLPAIRTGNSVDLIEGCTLRFKLEPATAILPLSITAMEPSEGQPGEAPRLEIYLRPSQSRLDRVVSSMLSAYGVVALLLLASVGLGIFLWGRKQREEESRSVGDGRSRGSGIRGDSPASPASMIAAPPPTPVQYASKADVDLVYRSLKNLETTCKNLADVQSRLRSELGSELSGFVERCQAAAAQAVDSASSSALQAAAQATNENERIRRRLMAIETTIAALQAESRKGLVNLLQAIPREALTGIPGADQANPELAQKLEQAVSRYLREEQPDAQSLAEHSQRAATLHSAIRQFREIAADSAAGQASVRLDPLDRELDLISQELAGFSRQGKEKRLRLLFAVDFSAHEAARQTLTEGIAAGLQREIVKLDSFDDYYAKRIGMLAAQIAAECADLADSVLDPQRINSAIQSVLQSVFTAAGVEEIAPRRNDPFLGTDHAMFQMIRRSSAVDRSGAVAQTVSRGLRQRDRIVRKATVILFE